MGFAADIFNNCGGRMDWTKINKIIKQIKEADYRAWVLIAVIVLLLILAYTIGKYSSIIDATNICNEFWQDKISKCICLQY